MSLLADGVGTVSDVPGPGLATAPGVAAFAPPSNLNLPNALTAGRLLLVPAFAAVLATSMESSSGRLIAWGLFTVACLTDVLDGHLARSRGQITAFGVMADPIADKALVGTALVGLSLLGLLPWWATAVIVGREIAVTLMRTALLRHGLLPASRGGKLKCLAQNIAVALYLLPLTGAAASVRGPVLGLAVVLTLVTAAQYVAAAARLRRP